MKLVALFLLAAVALVAADPCACPPSEVVFVADTSGSVDNGELARMKQAMGTIMTSMSNSQFAFTDSRADTDCPGLLGAIYNNVMKAENPTCNNKWDQPNTLQTLSFGGSAAVLSAMPTVKSHAATDLFSGMAEAIKAHDNSPTRGNNKVIIILFDGSHNVMVGSDLASSVGKGAAKMEQLVRQAQSHGIYTFFLGIETDAYQTRVQDAKARCEAAVAEFANSSPDKTIIEKCGPAKTNAQGQVLEYLLFSREEVKEAWENDKPKVKALCEKMVTFYNDQNQQIQWAKDNLSTTLQFQTANSWSALQSQVQALVGRICKNMGFTMHFDSNKDYLPCKTDTVKKYYNCDTEKAKFLEEIKCCKMGPIYIGAHTSSAGNKNDALSKRRATAMVNVLREGGFKGDVYTSAFGENQLADSNDSGDESSRAAAVNRRAVAYCGPPPASAGHYDVSAATKHPFQSP